MRQVLLRGEIKEKIKTSFEQCVVDILEKIFKLLASWIPTKEVYEEHISKKLTAVEGEKVFEFPVHVYKVILYASGADIYVNFDNPITEDSWLIEDGGTLVVPRKMQKLYYRSSSGSGTLRVLAFY